MSPALLNLYRRLVHLRADHAALRVGDYTPVAADDQAVYAFVRQAGDEAVLVVVNVSDAPVTDYALALDASPLRGRLRAEELLYRVSADAPRLGRRGGFDGYRPVATLEPHTGYVVRLAPR